MDTAILLSKLMEQERIWLIRFIFRCEQPVPETFCLD